MNQIKFRAWYLPQKKLYDRAYQKLSHVLLCEKDSDSHEGDGIPAIRASYDDCILDQNTTIFDKYGREIFENDVLMVQDGQTKMQAVVGPVPDMYKSRKLHPLKSVIDQLQCQKPIDQLEIEIIGHTHSSD